MQLLRPQPDLANAVECGVMVQRAAGTVSRFPAMPRAMLTVSWVGRGTPAVVFHALSTRATQYPHAEPLRAVGLVLWPHTAAQLMGMSTGAQVDLAVPWAELAGVAEAVYLDEALQQWARDEADCLLALQASLRRVLGRGPLRAQHSRAESLRQLCATVGRDGSRAAAALGLGERQLERRCRAELGMSPKQLQRITRWHGLLSGALRQQRTASADAALAAGYYDQSHLARECRLLTGASLRELITQAHADSAWWALRTPTLLAQWPEAPAERALRHHR